MNVLSFRITESSPMNNNININRRPHTNLFTAKSENEFSMYPVEANKHEKAVEVVTISLINGAISIGVGFCICRIIAHTMLNVFNKIAEMFTSKVEKSNISTVHSDKFLKPNSTLSSYEMEIFQTLTDPTTVESNMEEIIGLDHVKQSMLNLATIMFTNKTTSTPSHKNTKGFLLFGPPGCGKTILVRALCKKCQIPMINVVPSLLMRKYVGETSLMTTALFSLAEKIEPCIIFVDEMDALFRSRVHDDNSQVDRNLKTEFMQLWDQLKRNNKKILIIGSTNMPQEIDPAIQRRFDRSLLVGLPSEIERENLLKKLFLKSNVDKSFDFHKCAIWTDNYTPSDIENVCEAVKWIPIQEYLNKQDDPMKNPMDMKADHTVDNDVLKNTRSITIMDFQWALRTVLPTAWTARAYSQSINSLNTPNNFPFHSSELPERNFNSPGNKPSSSNSPGNANMSPSPNESDDNDPDDDDDEDDDDD